jgi:hypothetical protein
MTDFIVYCAFMIVALSPLLQRLDIQRFWVPARGTVIQLDGGFSNKGVWVRARQKPR